MRPGTSPRPTWLDRLRRARAAVWRPLVVAAVLGVVAWGLGMDGESALTLAAVTLALAAVLLRVDAVVEPRPEREEVHVRDGVRGEVQDLAWAMAGRDGRAGERALRHLRAAAARRLARHGLDLDDPEQTDAVVDLLGARAHRTVTHRQHPLPSVADLVHTVEVLERLGTTRDRTPARPAAPPAGPPNATPTPDPRSTR